MSRRRRNLVGLRGDCAFKRVRATAGSRNVGNFRHGTAHCLLRYLHIGKDVAQHHIVGDSIVFRVPAVVIGGAGEECEADFRFAR